MKNGDSHNGNNNLVTLDKKAVKVALKQDWETAIKLNNQILEQKPNDRKANMRMGMAYLQTKNFKGAEKIFKHVLKIDPINNVAKKNLELAKSKRQAKTANAEDAKQIIREPGTAATATIELSSKKLTASGFEPRQDLGVKINKASITIQKNGKTIGKVTDSDLVKRLNRSKKQKAEISAIFFGGKDKVIKILFKSNISIFKSEKQDFKPYMKKDAIDEPEIEMSTTEESD